MPAAAKLLADHHLSAAVAGRRKDGRITKSDVLAAVASGVGNTSSAASAVAQPASTAAIIPTGVPTAVLPQAAAPAPDLGERLQERIPMTRLRARIAERLLQSQSSNAILTTFNEVNMAPVMEMRKRFQEKFERALGVKRAL